MASPGPRTPARRRNPGQARQAAHRRGVDGHLADHDRAPHRRAEHPGQHLRAEGPPLDHTRLGQHRLYRLQPEHLDAFYTWLAAQGLKPNTIVQIHRILSRALKVAWKRGKTARNVAALVDAPAGEEIDIEPLTRAEARRILAAAGKRHNGVRWSVAFAVGIPPVRGDRPALEVRRPRRRHDRGRLATQAAPLQARLPGHRRLHRRPTPQAMPAEMRNPQAPEWLRARLPQTRPPLPGGETAVPGRMHRPRTRMPGPHRRRLALRPP